jgi:hypothetical protein
MDGRWSISSALKTEFHHRYSFAGQVLYSFAGHMLFYSLDDNGQTPTFTTPIFVNENADGSFHFVSVLGNTFDGLSDVPLPAALPLFATGLGALGLLGWRRKKQKGPQEQQD